MAPLNKAQDLFNVNGLVAVITGGGSGLGLYAARALDANGAKAVYIIGRRQATLVAAVKTGVNGSIKAIVGDVSSKDDLLRIASQIRSEVGYINLLFANAGISGPPAASLLPQSGPPASIADFQRLLLESSMEDFTQTLHVNNTAVYFTTLAFLDLLDAGNKKRNVPQDSQILVTTSIAGLSRHLASSFAYSTSKAAANHLVKMLSTHFSQSGYHIRANVVAPGLYPSEMTEKATGSMEKFQGVENHEDAFAGAHVMAKEKSPAERTGSEEDFAGVVLFMCSRAGAYLNGEVMVTDGGRIGVHPGTY
ncbi:hypothetical protein B0A48_05390 [Cryoendolithus antarcticus]|uniref:Uncharacterized protein n=1 Tax=Cryoendolithus antarcticus TaxID=1507870 RepID=A0A1V8TIL3_9PEZI|nr:hypothetical protein B0A48_05390 [Cryoendolithus antarcticus]